MSVISVSIDICNSTRIKQDVSFFGLQEPERVQQFYQDFVLQIAVNEMDFYASMVDGGLSLDRLYVVKAIGDEVWSLYELGDIQPGSIDFNNIVHAMVKATEAINTQHRSVTVSRYNPYASVETETGQMPDRKVRILPKVYLDLIDDYIDFSSVRTDYFRDRLEDLFARGRRFDTTTLTEDYPDIDSRLRFSNLAAKVGDKFETPLRTDPVGYEVDRFFRCAEAAIPGMTCVGERLYHALLRSSAVESREDPEFEETFMLATLQGQKVASRSYLQIQRVLNNLKGVQGDYTIYYLHDRKKFKQALRKWMEDPENYGETLEALAKRKGIREFIHRSRFAD